MKKTVLWTLAIYGALLAAMALWMWSSSDPGTDSSLNQKTFDELVQELGKPQSEVHSGLTSRILDDAARRAYLAIPDRGGTDAGVEILVAKWVRSGSGSTPLETTVWLRAIDGRWVAFHNYRRYLIAGL
jgi:hypothetical protein